MRCTGTGTMEIDRPRHGRRAGLVNADVRCLPVMGATSCETWWDARYPKSPPVGFLLRDAYPELWLRIHSLPASKRYPETDADYAELLRRHKAVATQALGSGALCYLVQPAWVLPSDDRSGWGVDLADHPYGANEERLAFDVAEVTWRPGDYDALLRATAYSRIAMVLLASRERGSVYAPYDGGADLFFRSQAERDEGRRLYADWLSPYPGGL